RSRRDRYAHDSECAVPRSAHGAGGGASHRAAGTSRRTGEGRAIPGVRRCLVCDRQGAVRGWRQIGQDLSGFRGGIIVIFATGLSAPEGPVALPDGTWLIVEGGAERGCVTHISADGQTKRIIKKTGRPNGLAVDSKGVIWVAESKTPSLVRLTMDGKAEVVATECDGEPFLFPNDLCFGPDRGRVLRGSGVFIERVEP